MTNSRWKLKAVTDFLYLGSKITSDSDCSHEIKTCLILGRKAMRNLDSILRSKDITLSTQVHIVRAMVLPLVMYEYESLIIKKAEELILSSCAAEDSWEFLGSQEIKPVNLKGNQPWIFIGKTMKLKLWYLGHLIWRADSFEKTLKLDKTVGKEEGIVEDEMIR